MIRKVCVSLAVLLVLLMALKAVKSMTRPRPARSQEVSTQTVGRVGDALRVHYQFWPPFAAENPVTNRNGYCLDILRRIFPGAVFKKDGLEIDELIEHFDKESVCATVGFGRHPKLKAFPQSAEPIAFYELAVLAPRAKPWVYAGPASLERIRLGYSEDYLEAPLVAEHWARHAGDPSRAVMFPPETDTGDWARKALNGEVDAFVVTFASRVWDSANSNLELEDLFRSSGPIGRVPLYLTVSGKEPAFAEAVLKEFSEGMARLRADGSLERLRHAYGLPPDPPAEIGNAVLFQKE